MNTWMLTTGLLATVGTFIFCLNPTTIQRQFGNQFRAGTAAGIGGSLRLIAVIWVAEALFFGIVGALVWGIYSAL
jgi:hypothetical protein